MSELGQDVNHSQLLRLLKGKLAKPLSDITLLNARELHEGIFWFGTKDAPNSQSGPSHPRVSEHHAGCSPQLHTRLAGNAKAISKYNTGNSVLACNELFLFLGTQQNEYLKKKKKYLMLQEQREFSPEKYLSTGCWLL